MQSRADSFKQLLASLADVEHVRGIAAALGFGDCWLDVAVQQWPELLDLHALQRLIIAGTRGRITALVLEVSELERDLIARIVHRLRTSSPGRAYLLLLADRHCEQLAVVALGAAADARLLLVECKRPLPSDLETLAELVPAAQESDEQLAARHLAALDRVRMSRQFFREFKAQRNAIADAWKHLPRAATDDRNQLALLLLCRMMFLYFLQKRGHLPTFDYLYQLWLQWKRRRHRSSFFEARLKPLFFGVLNTRPPHRTGGARRFGALPYLNGGLFERHALERRHRKIDINDRVLASMFDDLLQHFRFTTVDSAHAAASSVIDSAIDPEMLGRVFEELMAERQRGETGTFFTPPQVVDRLVRLALGAWAGHRSDLQRITVLDPACGSGAFLLGALARLAQARAAVEGGSADDYKRAIIERSLHGVDLQSDAALLCALRLWLALLPGPAERVQPLPNLDRRIRQGDALLDPLDLGFTAQAGTNATVRTALAKLKPLGERYVRADPAQREPLRTRLEAGERKLAEAWLDALARRHTRQLSELRARAGDVDLFGDRTADAIEAARQIAPASARIERTARLREELAERSALPFFSFPVHFGDSAPDGFDLVVSNPPWVRAHDWPDAIGNVRQQYEVCRPPRSGNEAASASQIDLSLLFLERGIRLLKPNGVLAMLLPAKAFRSLYAGAARALLLRETRLVALEDHSLDQHSLFQADAFTGCVVAVRGNSEPAPIRITSFRKRGPPLEFELCPEQLPLRTGDAASPWLLVPPAIGAALRKMQDAGRPIRKITALPVHRGVFTGANDVFLVEEFEPKLGDHAWIRAEGYRRPHGETRRSRYRALIEESCVKPVVRGATLRPWSYDVESYMIWGHDRDKSAASMPKRTSRYLKRHESRLLARSSGNASTPIASVFGVAEHTYSAKVAWRDLAADLQSVVLPARIRSHGRQRELIPLNTVYYISTSDDASAHLLAGYLNSLPIRTFARAIAERAKDAHFRFFAWVIGELPLPSHWQDSAAAERITAIAMKAAVNRRLDSIGQQELDRIVGEQFGLTTDDLDHLVHYDRWLRGEA